MVTTARTPTSARLATGRTVAPHAVRLGAAALLACLPASALAAGFFMPTRGVRPTSNAGAVVAGVDDAWALWYNPANLCDGSSLRATVDASAVIFGSSFKRWETGELADNIASPLAVPSFGLASNAGDQSLPTFAIGFTAPYAGAVRFAEDSAARYSLVDSSGTLLAFVHAAAAYEVWPGLRVGLGLQNVIATIRQVSAASAYTGLFGRPEDLDLDMLSEVLVHDIASLSGNLGVTWQPVPTSILAFSFQAPYHVNGSGTMRLRLPGSYFFDGATVTGEQVNLALRFPPVVRLAYRHVYRDLWQAEAALVAEFWSYHDEVRIVPHDIVLRGIPGIGDYALQPITIRHDYQNAVSLHLGGSYNFQPGLEGRAGLAYESQAIPAPRQDAALLDGHKVLLGLGLSYQLERFRLDASYGFLLYAPRDVDNSQVLQLNPTNPQDAVVVGNGTYRGQAHLLGLALSFSL